MATQEYKSLIQQKLEDPILRRNLGNFADSYIESRAKAYAGKDIEAIRDSIKCSKQKIVNNLDQIADRFQKSAEAKGAKVFRATTAQDAVDYIANLAKEKNAKTIVKSKSMASEEIHLNHALENEKFRVLETDLGEWIIQLAGEKPSHMVMPAIHKSRGQIAELFSKSLNKEITDDITGMVKVARETLRKEFAVADFGISGGNIAVAETGTVVLVTNEGNARLTTTLPPVHVVLVGYEKLVENFSDVGPILEALPRSATGQRLTSYVTMVTGATQTENLVTGAMEEKELHIVLLDNGRRAMAKDPVVSKAFQCIRCASCLNVCPIYQLLGGHVYGKIYAGGIGVILTSYMEGLKEVDDLQELCISCGRCKSVCPGKVPITDLIVEIRDRLFTQRKLPFKARFIFNNVLSNRKLFHTALKAAGKVQKPIYGGNEPMMRHLPLYGLTDYRSLPAISDSPFRDRYKQIKQDVSGKKGTVAYYVGCATDFAYPEIGAAVVKVLNAEGYQVVFPEEQGCCGTPARYMGDLPTSKKLAKNNIQAFEKANADYLLCACPSCIGAWLHDYENIFKDEPEWQARAKALKDKTVEFTKFVLESRQQSGRVSKLPQHTKITYHDSCHLKRNHGIFAEPRQLLTDTQGAELVEMAFADRCCGCGGSFSLKYPELAAPMMEAKLNTIEATDADIVAMACPGCMMQIKGGLDKKKSKIKTRHVAQILAEDIK